MKFQVPNFKLFGTCILFLHLVLVSCILYLGLTGCARNITQKVAVGAQMTVEITYKGNIDLVNNRYLIILGTQEVQIPIRPTTLDAFVEPGETAPPGSSSTEAYYQKYFSAWSGYIKNSDVLVYLVKGPFVSSTETYTLDHIGDLTQNTNKISFTLTLSKIFAANPTRIYFDFVTVDTSQAIKYTKDHLDSSRYIENYVTNIANGLDDIDSTINPNLDIESWKVEIQ